MFSFHHPVSSVSCNLFQVCLNWYWYTLWGIRFITLQLCRRRISQFGNSDRTSIIKRNNGRGPL